MGIKYFFSVAVLATAILCFSFPQVSLAENDGAIWCYTFTKTMSERADRSLASEVEALQTALAKEGLYTGSINGLFNSTVTSAVKAFQEKYAREILAPYGLTKGTGKVAASTRKKLNALYGCETHQPSVKIVSPSVNSTIINKNLTVSGFCPNYSGSVNVFYYSDIKEETAVQCVSGVWSTNISINSDAGSGTLDLYAQLSAIDSIQDKVKIKFNWSNIEPAITITSPATGAKWMQGTRQTISWTSAGISLLKIQLINSAGTAYDQVVGQPAADGQYTRVIDANMPAGDEYRIKIYDQNNFQVSATSESFSIVAPAVTVYHAINYGGASQGYAVGTYTLDQMEANGSLDNDISSVKVVSGYKATFYKLDNFVGASLVKTADDPTLVNDVWNDVISSMKVEAIQPPPTCTSWTYSNWSVCVNGTQTRLVRTSSPTGCTGGNPVITQACTPATACTDSDNGKNYLIKGTLTTDASEWTSPVSDSCQTSVSNRQYQNIASCTGNNCYISEYYCNGVNPVKNSPVKCTNGCTDGACATWCYTFTKTLSLGSRGDEVVALQTALIAEEVYNRNASGIFDATVVIAVKAFQEKYASEILAPYGLTKGTGKVAAATRNKLNALYGCDVPPPIEDMFTLTTTAVNGTITRSPDRTSYSRGSSVQLTATHSAGYRFVNWTGSVTGTTNPATITMNGNKSVTANFAADNGQPSITVTSPSGTVFTDGVPTQISWTSLSAPVGSMVGIQIMGEINGDYESWGYSIGNYNNATSGSINWTPRVLRQSGEKYHIKATLFAQGTTDWNGTTLAQSKSQTFTINLPQGVTRSLTITSPTASSTLTAGQTYPITWQSSGIASTDKIQLTYEPIGLNSEQGGPTIATISNSGSYQWTVPANIISGQYRIEAVYINEYEIYGAIGDSDYFTVVAAENPATYTLTTTAVNGTITKTPNQSTFNSGDTVTLTAAPSAGYRFVNWTGDATGTTSPVTITMTANKSVTANFAQDSVACTDTDNGKNYFTKGTATGLYGAYTDLCYAAERRIFEYYCDADRGYSQGEWYNCPNGCSDGACISDSSCNPSWSCAAWNTCESNQQTRVCTDSNNCGVATDKPEETRACVANGCVDSDVSTAYPDGKNYFTSGTVIDNSPTALAVFGHAMTFTDICYAADKRIFEYYCDTTLGYSRGEWHDCPNGCSNGACIQGSALVPNNKPVAQQNVLDLMAASLASIAEQIRALLLNK